MSSLHKMKLWFGMVDPDEYDEYAPEYNREHALRVDDAGYEVADKERAQEHGPRSGSTREPALAGHGAAPADGSARLEPLRPQGRRPSGGGVRGALALEDAEPVRRSAGAANPFAGDGRHPLATITTLHPRTYNEARTIGERFREGNPVIMNLTEMSDSDAKRLVDFAAGLAFAMRGAIDKVTNKVFLLSPSDVDVSAEDRRRLAETGFFHST